jgi:hypothetical protein
MFSSSSILMVMTVLVIDMANARNIESTNDDVMPELLRMTE